MTDLDALRALVAKATPGPWRYWTQRRPESEDTCTFRGKDGAEVLRAVTISMTEADAALIVAAVNALPALLDELNALRECVNKADVMRQGEDCPMCDSGKLRNPVKLHWDTCAFANYDAARAKVR